MAVATKFWFAASLLHRARVDLIELEGGKDWVRQLAAAESAP
jgi:heme exporter protein C